MLHKIKSKIFNSYKYCARFLRVFLELFHSVFIYLFMNFVVELVITITAYIKHGKVLEVLFCFPSLHFQQVQSHTSDQYITEGKSKLMLNLLQLCYLCTKAETNLINVLKYFQFCNLMYYICKVLKENFSFLIAIELYQAYIVMT